MSAPQDVCGPHHDDAGGRPHTVQSHIRDGGWAGSIHTHANANAKTPAYIKRQTGKRANGQATYSGRAETIRGAETRQLPVLTFMIETSTISILIYWVSPIPGCDKTFDDDFFFIAKGDFCALHLSRRCGSQAMHNIMMSMARSEKSKLAPFQDTRDRKLSNE